MVRIANDYSFEGPDGLATLPDLFDGYSQLIVRHAMFDPEWERTCPTGTAAMDETSPALLAHLRSRDTAYAAISRAPYPKLAEYLSEHDWTFPWYSSFGSDFNYDFGVTLDPAVARSTSTTGITAAHCAGSCLGRRCFCRATKARPAGPIFSAERPGTPALTGSSNRGTP